MPINPSQMFRLRHSLLAVALCLAPAVAAAYEVTFTHRWISRAAVEHLVRTHAGYEEALTFIEPIVEGSLHEDDLFLDGDIIPTTLRVQRHFYRPTDQTGLEMDGIRFPNSYDWGVEPRADNEWGFDDALEHYRRGDLHAAYFTLGHTVHLVQDLTVPAHTHLDIHGPPLGDDYEQHCFRQMEDQKRSNLPKLPLGLPVPAFQSLKQIWKKTSEASYWRNMLPGDLSNHQTPQGLIVEAFPQLFYSSFSQVWRIDEPKVGKLDVDFFEHQPGLFYFKNLKMAASQDRSGFNIDSPREVNLTANPDGKPMVEHVARDLVPVAVLHSAAVIRYFLDHRPEIVGVPSETFDTPLETTGCAAVGGSADASLIGLVVLVGLLGLRRQTRKTQPATSGAETRR